MKTKLIGVAAIAAGLAAVHGTARADNQIDDKDIVVIKPAPGRETIRPMKPDWCGTYKSKGNYNSQVLEAPQHSINEAVMYDRKPDDGYEDLQTEVGSAACEWPNDPSVQKQVAYWRQLYINMSGMTEAEDRAALKLLMNFDKAGKLQDEQIAKYKTWDTDAPDEATRVVRRMIKPLLFDKNELVSPSREHLAEIEFFLDTPGRPSSMIERVMFVWTCLGNRSNDGAMFSAMAQCGADARRIDVKAADAEAVAWGLNELGRLRVHTYAIAAKAAYATHEPEILDQDKKAKKFQIKKTVLDDPDAAYGAWDAFYAAHKDLYAIGTKAEAVLWAPSDSSDRVDAVLKGDLGKCSAAFSAEYRKIAAAAKVKSIDEVKEKVLADPWTGYVMEHLALCDLAEHKYLDALVWLHLLHDGGGVAARGPRYSVHAQGLADENELDKAHLSAEVPDHPQDQLYATLSKLIDDESLVDGRNWTRIKDGEGFRAEGTITSIKKNADGTVTLHFKKEHRTYEQEDCVDDTSVIERISSDGHVEYRQICHPAPPLVITRTQDPITLTADTAPMVKVGQWVQFIVPTEQGIKDQKDKNLWGFPFAGLEFAKGKDRPSMYAMVPIGK